MLVSVTDEATGLPMPGVPVTIVQESNWGTGALTDGQGQCSLYGSAGSYQVFASRRGYLCKQTQVSLPSGGTTNLTLTMTRGTLDVAGRLFDWNTGQGLGGVMIMASSPEGWFSFGFTDHTGAYGSKLLPGSWKLRVDPGSLAMLGYVGYDEPFETNLTASVANLQTPVLKANSLIYGRVTDEENHPVIGLGIMDEEPNNLFQSLAVSYPPQGDYCLSVIAGPRSLEYGDAELQARGYIQPVMQVNAPFLQALRADVNLKRATRTITGTLRDASGNGIPGIGVGVWTSDNGTDYRGATETLEDGSFRLGVFDGLWGLNLDCDTLMEMQYECPDIPEVTVAGTEVFLDLVANSMFEPLEITTTALPGRQAGLPYAVELTGYGGVEPYQWEAAGALPPGLEIEADTGWISGTPELAGQYNFSVTLTDQTQNSISREFQMTVHPRPPGFPMATNQFNEVVLGVARDGTNILLSFYNSTPTSNITVQLLSTSGNLIGPRLNLGRTGATSQAVFGADRYLLVWEDRMVSSESDLYGQFIDPSGSLMGGPFPICTAAGPQNLDSRKGMIFDGTNFFLMWRDQRGGAGNWGIYGRLIAPDGTLLGNELVLTAGGNPFSPTMVFDGAKSLAAWISPNNSPADPFAVWGRYVLRSGVMEAPFRISQGYTPRAYQVRLACNDGGTILAIWGKDAAPGNDAPAAWDIWGRLILPRGNFAGPEFPLVTNPTQEASATVIGTGTEFLVSWLDNWGGAQASQQGLLVSGNGLPMGAQFTLARQAGGRVPLGPVIVTDDGRLLCLWTYALYPYQENQRSSSSEGDVSGEFRPFPPIFRSIQSTANGACQVRYEGGRGYTNWLEASANLQNWTILLVTNNASNSITYTDPQPGNPPRRFYRVRVQ